MSVFEKLTLMYQFYYLNIIFISLFICALFKFIFIIDYSFMMCGSSEELKSVAQWQGKGEASRAQLMDQLQQFLPPSIMLPPRRCVCYLIGGTYISNKIMAS